MANFVVLDTETCPTVNYKDNNAHPETSLVYDFGYTIRDNDNNVLRERSFVIAETFYQTSIMNSAYYADKLPLYHEGIKRNEWDVISFLEAWRTFKADCKEFKVNTAWAYNCNFDTIALNNTLRTYSNGYAQWFFPYTMKVRDVWDYASNITSTKGYLKFCVENGLFTATGNPSTSAENVYRYISRATSFVEDHTALSDARIESAILFAAKAKKKKTRHSKGQGWRDAAKAFKTFNY